MTLPTENTPVAKSLHTLKVIEQIGALALRLQPEGVTDAASAIAFAMGALGLAGRPDPYDLRKRALANLLKKTGAAQ